MMTDKELSKYLRDTWPLRSEFGEITTKQRMAIHLAADRLEEIEQLRKSIILMSDAIGKELLEALLKDNPAPWSVEKYGDGALSVFAGDDSDVMFVATFTGDGATISLSDDAIYALVGLVNYLSLAD